MQLVAQNNQKILIYLRNVRGVFNASVLAVSFAGGNTSSRLISRGNISNEEATYLIENKATLEAKNVFVIESVVAEAETILLTGNTFHKEFATFSERAIPSPFVYNILKQLELFSTQKTRAPNF